MLRATHGPSSRLRVPIAIIHRGPVAISAKAIYESRSITSEKFMNHFTRVLNGFTTRRLCVVSELNSKAPVHLLFCFP